MKVDNIALKNTHNADKNDRGTKDFEVSLSNSSTKFGDPVLKGLLKDPRGLVFILLFIYFLPVTYNTLLRNVKSR